MQTKYQILLYRRSQLRKAQYGMVLLVLLLALCAGNLATVSAQGVTNEYLTTKTLVLKDGTSLEALIIHGPPTPPPGFEAERAQVVPEAAKTISAPAYHWVFGCSAVSGAMIAGYWDRNGYPNMYTGPTGGGVMPMNDTSWPTWSDGVDTYPNNPLIASHQGVDGRATKGSIDDYWVQYGSSASDPYISGSWTQHTWGTAIGDYMKTSQSAYGNTDGSTTFWGYTTSASPLTCADMVSAGISTTDGTYGRKLFYEARGYTVTDCYSQKTDNTATGGFSYAQYKAEIDANRPVMINLAGHTIVGVGYNDPNTIYIHDTWASTTEPESMTWGGSYSGMQMLSVSIVNLTGGTPPCTGFNSQFNGSTTGWSRVKGTWTNYLAMYYHSTGIANKGASTKHTGNYGNFTYEVRMKRTGTCTSCANRIIIRGKPTSLDSTYWWKPSYVFQYSNNGQFSVYEMSSGGTVVALKGWTSSSYIVNGWNTLKVIANGSSLKYYINGHLVWSGSDSTLTSGQVGFGFYRDAAAGTMDVNWAKLTCPASDAPADLSEEVASGVELPGGTLDQSP